METKTISTKAEPTAQGCACTQTTENAVLISKADAEEYRTYKQQKSLATVTAALERSQGSLLLGEDVQKVCERAVRLRQPAVQTPLSKLPQAAFYLGKSKVKLDCVVGGRGETHVKVKAYETRMAVKKSAKEITLVLTPSLVDACRYGEIRREIKKVRRAAKRAAVKVRIEKTYSPTVLSRLARLCSDLGVKFFSVPDFQGCERLRMDLTHGCQLEVFGVETLSEYRHLIGAGVGRIVTNRAMEFYTAWIKECNETLLSPLARSEKETDSQQDQKTIKTEEDAQKMPLNDEKVQNDLKTQQTIAPQTSATTLSCSSVEQKSETDYRCRLEGTQLKFL